MHEFGIKPLHLNQQVTKNVRLAFWDKYYYKGVNCFNYFTSK